MLCQAQGHRDIKPRLGGLICCWKIVLMSSLLKSLKLGVGSVRQEVYAPSNFGFDANATQAANNPTSASNLNTSTKGNANNNQEPDDWILVNADLKPKPRA
ncbi:unnamed protein product [Rhizoctonia solani]|uniref:Uncharacterized protein n=1 Tax=Rhizoctonia solani TaxID=456999 RepID=A0A8H3GPE8_9AGAM|nr:unnamed protein product [Rhizoctonia solani]